VPRRWFDGRGVAADPVQPSGVAWLGRLRAGELSSRELVERYLARVDAVNPALNAVVARDDEAALDAADAADRARRAGEERPLLGLPVTIKDSLATAGLVTTSGSLARARHVPAVDATVVARLRAAGAIVLGKTNLPEYAWSYETDNVVYGRTVHPRDPARTPGGSSGGESAILGADASVLGIGTDGGGSIRVPSHYCGIVGLRPTAGLVPETGYWPATRTTGMLDLNCIGPMARHVEDLVLVLPLLAGRDDVDPLVQGVAVGGVADVDVPSLRVGLYTYDGAWRVTPATAAGVERCGRVLAELGCAVEEATPPDVTEATDLFFRLMAADGGARARADLAPAQARHVEQLASLLRDLEPLALDASGYFGLLERAFALRASLRAFVSRYDVVLAPVTIGSAPLHGRRPGDDGELESYLPFNYTHAYSVAGLPVAVVPVAAERGLPLGIQIVGSAFCDHVALAVAAVLEAAFGGFAGPGRAGLTPAGDAPSPSI
jgi:Asp-tRNA(Asn)/Glu-tRNA(Gln) amidotransferase A subunit family amidase